MSTRYMFDVFRRTMVVEPAAQGWRLLAVGADGKGSPADAVVPAFIQQHELAQ